MVPCLLGAAEMLVVRTSAGTLHPDVRPCTICASGKAWAQLMLLAKQADDIRCELIAVFAGATPFTSTTGAGQQLGPADEDQGASTEAIARPCFFMLVSSRHHSTSPCRAKLLCL